MDRRTVIAGLAGAPLSLQGCASMRGAGGPASQLQIRFDGSAVPAMIGMYRATRVSEAEIDRLLALRGVQAMIDNTTRFVPESTRPAFRAAIREHVETRNPTTGRFGLRSSAANIAPAETALTALQAGEAAMARRIVARLEPYWPNTGPLTVTCYYVMAGASDGFIMDDSRPEAFAALDRSQGDALGVEVNLTHEVYHVGQKVRRLRSPGLADRVADRPTTPGPIRLLTSVLDEGTANYAADPLRLTGDGPYFAMWRDRFARNAAAERVAENFALFDRIARVLREGQMSWEQAYAEGFSGTNDARLYFVGYQMAKALDAAKGPRAIAGAFGRHPAAFFQAYVQIARQGHAPRFASTTEDWLLSLPTA